MLLVKSDEIADAISLGDQGHQGDYGEQFVQALAIVSGLDTLKSAYRDRCGVDWQIQFPGNYGPSRYPKIEVQVKTWSQPHGDDLAWRYPLRVKNFNNLAGDGFALPRFLFLVIVPDGQPGWTEVSSDNFVLRQAVYWESFLYHDPLPDRPPESTHTVSVPYENLLTIESLLTLFDSRFVKRRAS
jgi:hypothetical protein